MTRAYLSADVNSSPVTWPARLAELARHLLAALADAGLDLAHLTVRPPLPAGYILT
jgi:hypothetical protein